MAYGNNIFDVAGLFVGTKRTREKKLQEFKDREAEYKRTHSPFAKLFTFLLFMGIVITFLFLLSL